MKGAAWELLNEFKKSSSPFMQAQLILEIGSQLDRITPELDDAELVEKLRTQITRLREAHEKRSKRNDGATVK